MAAFRPSKAFNRVPVASKVVVNDPEQLLGYLNGVVRAVDGNFLLLNQLNNETFIINPEATVRTSIAGNTTDLNKIRDCLLTFLQAVKSNGGIN